MTPALQLSVPSCGNRQMLFPLQTEPCTSPAASAIACCVLIVTATSQPWLAGGTQSSAQNRGQLHNRIVRRLDARTGLVSNFATTPKNTNSAGLFLYSAA